MTDTARGDDLATARVDRSMTTEPGLRERKKERTRQLIAETARALFAERGFDRVTVAEIARAADVSEATVFNYFPSKEDLVYQRMEAFEQELLHAIQDRPEGESLLAAFARFILQRRGMLASQDPATTEQLTRITRVISDSPALLARERQILDNYTDALALAIARETDDEIGAWVTANAMIGVHRALLHYTRHEILAGTAKDEIATALQAHGRRLIELLENGVAIR
jgi:AcrR family transcriptional regulator